MKIKGRRDVYDVVWGQVGFSYTTVKIYKKRRWWTKKLLWESSGPGKSVNLTNAEKMYPQKMYQWFNLVVKEYEDYLDAVDYQQGL